MTRIIIELQDDEVQQLSEEARLRNVSVEELARAGVLALVNERSAQFSDALEYVLQKNSELYRRLA